MWKLRTGLLACVVGVGLVAPASAEVSKITIAEQFGILYLQMMVMQEEGLVQKHAAELGIDELQVDWIRLSGSGPMNDALLSGSMDVASGGLSGLITLWDRTKGSGMDVKGLSALNSMPINFVTSRPEVKGIADLTEEDRIAVTTVKVSPQAVLVQMAAAKEWGFENYSRLDHLTVSLPHPEAASAMLSKSGGITAHVASPPYDQREIRAGAHSFISSYDVLGDKASIGAVWMTQRFVEANPKVTQAVFNALEEATEIINADKQAAAELYLRKSGEDDTVENTLAYMESPEVEFTITPIGTKAFADFMARVGTIKAAPEPWSEMYFPLISERDGS